MSKPEDLTPMLHRMTDELFDYCTTPGQDKRFIAPNIHLWWMLVIRSALDRALHENLINKDQHEYHMEQVRWFSAPFDPTPDKP